MDPNMQYNNTTKNNPANDHRLYEYGEKIYIQVFPPGYRFVPGDDELIISYLKKKILNEPIPYCMNIHEVNVYEYNPEQLSVTFSGEKEWYFFTPRDRKYPNGTRPNRAAGTGFWKATGADKPVLRNGVVVGKKKALVFYNGKPPNGKKTSWIMHEFRVDVPNHERRSTPDMKLDDWVLCRIHNHTNKSNRQQQTYDDHQEPNGNIVEQPLSSNGLLMNRLGIYDIAPQSFPNDYYPDQGPSVDANSNFNNNYITPSSGFEGVNEVMPLYMQPMENNSEYLMESTDCDQDIWQMFLIQDDVTANNHQNPTNSTTTTTTTPLVIEDDNSDDVEPNKKCRKL